MKKAILVLTTIFLSLFATAQYPSYYIKNGDTLGIIISIEQAQKIDNDYDLLELLKKSKIESDKLDTAYVSVINNYGLQIAELKLKVNTLNGIITLKDTEILNLKDQISKYKENETLSDLALAKKDTIINNYSKENKKLKRQKFLGFTLGGGSLLGIIILLVIK